MMASIFKVRLKEKKNGCISEPVDVMDFIYNNDIEFEFRNWVDEDGEIYDSSSLPYNDFIFFQEEYEVIITVEEKWVSTSRDRR